MKVTFFSNFFNDHQIPLCNELYNSLGTDFTFVSSEKFDMDRLEIGFINRSIEFPYVLDLNLNHENEVQALKLGYESDIVIIGSASEKFIEKRLKDNKLTIRYSERFFKQGVWRLIDPRVLKYNLLKHTINRNKNLHVLCASAYTALDSKFIFSYPNKTYKWGYFPEFKTYNMNELFSKKNNKVIELLWVGRFINLKHPEKAIKIAKKLRDNEYCFKLRFIGSGALEIKLRYLVSKYSLDNNIEFLGPMPPVKVREYMEKSNIFLFTSDYNEGWGVVLNEAMNSGCAIVASHAIGSVPFLIKNNSNGLIYKNSSLNGMFKQVKRLIENRDLCIKLGEEAYRTISSEWNAHIAAHRMLSLFEALLSNKEYIIDSGPCSKAYPISRKSVL